MRELLGKLDRLQKTLTFKVIASVLVLALVGVVIGVYAAKQAERSAQTNRLIINENHPAPDAPKETEAEKKAREELLRSMTTHARVINHFIDQQFTVSSVAIGACVAAVPVLAAIWLGVGLTYLGLNLLGAAVVVPLMLWGGPSARSTAVFVAGALILAQAFIVLTQVLRLLLSPAHPITAIARNVIAEAVRMKVSLVFIVLLIVGLAALPGLIDANTPLRYRVQSFLQYGSGAAFTLSAILCVFLAAASVAFEQRDKIIWQTMTKPVKPWHYVLGKWLGVTGVAAVLLGVSCTGVFLFTEYLRRTQTAVDEIAPYVSAKGEGAISEDRMALESQVLVGRRSERPVIQSSLDAEIEHTVAERVKKQNQLYKDDPRANNPADESKIRKEVEGELLAEFLSLAPGAGKSYEFLNLADAKSFDLPITLRYKVHMGADAPNEFAYVTFYIEGSRPVVRSTALGQTLTMPLSAASIMQRSDSGGGNTRESLVLAVFNGDALAGRANEKTISFAPDGLEITYAVSSFRANFIRVAIVMWLKLSFLTMLAIASATFLSFPVACMVSFGAFIVAEGTKGLSNALDYFNPGTGEESRQWAYDLVLVVARPITWMFKFYGDLNPVNDLVEGKLVSWGSVSGGMLTLGVITVVLGLIGTWIFRSRELATYSGQ